MMKSAVQVAEYILRKSREVNDTITPMQILKLVYLCHGWMLGLYGRQLIEEEIEAWQYGPVIPELYHQVKHYRSQAITGQLCANLPDFDFYERSIIDQVYAGYGQYSGPALSRLTHEADSPWHITWTLCGKNSVISNDLIEDYYRKLAMTDARA